ncbi:MAG: ABC transporter ATP-binding protein [Actinobacteria bacterium]|nr:ABC transporter ATP-binding protein [Actinomycetota bacterium]
MSTQPIEVDARPGTGPTAFLSVRDLRVHFPTDDGLVKSVDGLTFDVERGQTVGIVGESGSGKSVTSQAILGLHKGSRAQITGEIWLDGQELVGKSEDEIRSFRGNQMAMIFQDPLSSLHPFYSVGRQISEAYLVHNRVSKAVARKRAVEMLNRVGIPNADRRYDDFPHQFSGGMRQRAMIAMALVSDPQLLIADEPTTALDVTVQAQILELMKDLQREFNSAIILITHDLGVVAETCDSVVVMYGGQCVETGAVDDIFYRPEMPYTWGLLTSMPRMDRTRQQRLQPIPGQPPSLIQVPSGCVFHPRCRFRDHVRGDACTTVHPDLLPTEQVGLPGAIGHSVRCHIEPQERRRIWVSDIKPGL